jgi:hypothetical protein
VPASPANPPEPAFKDRSTGLLVLGIIEIAGGAFAALAIPFVFLSAILMRKGGGPAMPLRSFAVTCLTYALLAVVLVTLGIGATKAKRWAWALNLVVSWIWLITGVMVTIMLIAVVPSSILAGMRTAASQNPSAPPVPAGFMAVIVTFMIVVAAVFLVVLPLIFLLFYRSKNVELTCKQRDPVERWTDRRPLPVTALALLAAASAAYYLVLSVATPLFPFFGRYLTGRPATALFLLFAVVDTYIAVAFLRLKLVGWWVALVAILLRLSSSAITIGRANLLEAYSKMGWSPQQLEAISMNPMFRGNAILWWSMMFMVLYFGFLLWLKRYFRAPAPASYTGFSDSTPIQPGS